MVWINIASITMALTVALGAFGAHILKEELSAYSLDVFEKAVFYQFIHALGLFVVAWLCTLTVDVKVQIAGWLMLMGIVFFSGSLYVLSLTGIKWLGAITPIGGVCFILSWLLIALTKYGI